MPTNIILISHNEFASGLKKAAEMITGQQPNVTAYDFLETGLHPVQIVEEIKKSLNPQSSYIILVDLLGGSVCNAAVELTEFPNVTLLAGMNLPLLVELILTEPQTKVQLEAIMACAREGIRAVSFKKEAKEEDFF